MNENSKSALLIAKQISHKFDYSLFKNIDISLYPKESIAIIGESGSGKSTLLNILSSLLKPNSGEVLINNKNLFKLNKKDILKLRRNFIGIIFQAHYLLRGFSAIENLEVALMLSKQNLDINLLEQLKIDNILGQNIGSLSGGQQQRLSIARVLLKKPKIIFADEPTGNLDEETANEVIDVLFKYINNFNAGMFLVTHDKNLAFRCDKVYELKNLKLECLK